MHSVEAVSFPNRSGQKLFGTLHRPALTRPDVPVVVLLSPGVKMRVGPGRLYVPLTEMLNALGYTVLRFDFFGLGDSEGELLEASLVDVYNHIEVGRYVDDTLSALNWLRQSQNSNRFILGGLCGGAITALLAAERDASVEALLSLGMTVTLASNAATPAKYLTMRKPKAPAPAAAEGDAPLDQRGHANPLFPAAYFAFLQRGGRALMLFSQKDRLYSEYREKFAEPYAERLQAYLPQLEEHVVPNANHVLSLHEWQREMVEVSRRWLSTLHPSVTP